jgi:hypothetical protein
MYRARRKAITAPRQDPIKQLSVEARIPNHILSKATVKAYPAPKTNSVGGMKITAR